MDRYVRVEQAKTEQSSIIDNEVYRSSSFRDTETEVAEAKVCYRFVSWQQDKFVII